MQASADRLQEQAGKADGVRQNLKERVRQLEAYAAQQAATVAQLQQAPQVGASSVACPIRQASDSGGCSGGWGLSHVHPAAVLRWIPHVGKQHAKQSLKPAPADADLPASG